MCSFIKILVISYVFINLIIYFYVLLLYRCGSPSTSRGRQSPSSWQSLPVVSLQTPSARPTRGWSMTAAPGSFPTSWSAAPTMRRAPPTGWTWSASSRTVSRSCGKVTFLHRLLIAPQLGAKWRRSAIQLRPAAINFYNEEGGRWRAGHYGWKWPRPSESSLIRPPGSGSDPVSLHLNNRTTPHSSAATLNVKFTTLNESMKATLTAGPGFPTCCCSAGPAGGSLSSLSGAADPSLRRKDCRLNAAWLSS